MNVTPAVYNPSWKFGTIERIENVIGLLPTYVDLADRIAYTEFVPGALRGNPPAVLAALMAGAERGLGPMESLRSIHVIDGRPTLSAEVMRALVLSAGHEIVIDETNEHTATLRARRRGTDHWSPPFVWTIERARRADLTNKPTWKRYPEAMLLARCSTDLCRAVFPDIVAGLSSTEEWGDVIDTTSSEDRPESARHPSRDEPILAPELAAVGRGPAAVERPLDELEEAPHDLDLARRLHAQITETFPGATTATRDRIRHALVAIVTRKRPSGPVVSSSALSHLEQMVLSDRIVDIRRGRATVVDWLDVDERGVVELRAAGWTYLVELEPLSVSVARSDTASVDSEPGTPEGTPPSDPESTEPEQPSHEGNDDTETV